MQAAATAPALALAPPVFLSLQPTAARPRRAARATAVRCDLAAAAPAAPGALAAPRWAQRTVVIPPQRRGCHIVTHKIMHAIRSDLSEFKCGLAHLFLHHTSASLTLNENYDPDVQTDTETFLNRVVPEGPSAPWRHTIEGPDDMPAHIKSSMFGFLSLMGVSTWELGRVYGSVNIAMALLLARSWLRSAGSKRPRLYRSSVVVVFMCIGIEASARAVI